MTIFFMILVNTPGSWSYVYSPLQHAPWHGCTPTDLVFPFFLFVVGLSMTFSFKKLNEKNKKAWLTKVGRRVLLIFLVGILLNWFPFFHIAVQDLRVFGVLQRIALSFGLASLIVIFIDAKWHSLVVIILLLGYWGLLYVFGPPGDPYSLEANMAQQIDLWLLEETHLYQGFGIPFDPEGLLGTLPAAISIMIGYLIGQQLLNKDELIHKIKVLIIAAIACIVVGKLWGIIFPINKALWTSSYVLYTSGWAIFVLSLLLFIIDVKKWQRWTFPFQVFGLNPLISYVFSIALVNAFLYIFKIDGSNFYDYLFSEWFQPYWGNYLGSFLFAFFFSWLVWLLPFWLYKKGKLIKL